MKKKIKIKSIIALVVGVLVLLGVLDASTGKTIEDNIDAFVPEDTSIEIDVNDLIGEGSSKGKMEL